MKKGLILTAVLFILSSGAYAYADTAAQTTQTILNNMKDAMIRDVQNSVNQTVNAGVNSLRLASLKAQLAQKKRELKQVEQSDDNFFMKNYRIFRIKQQIRELEQEISDLERQLHY